MTSNIYGEEVLFQIINGIAKEENTIDKNKKEQMIGIARKLGKYDEAENELHIVKWIPFVNEPVFVFKNDVLCESDKRIVANESIGILPGTKYTIKIKDVNALVTHNTAILGILGIGKSCLAYEIIKKVIFSGIKIICIDITNQYYSENGLLQYVDSNEIEENLVVDNFSSNADKTGAQNMPSNWGNEKQYRDDIYENIKNFTNSNKKILILNPDFHPVKKAASNFNITELYTLTTAEKTRIISEEILKHEMSLGQTDNARILIIYEEAHSLIPEWNSVSNSGDQSASNGTAKVILQGRKYGLGSLIITQRTANISKSVLNQCNTIFALRIFDDTGKNFLENYMGTDYTNTLPTLEERHAVVFGKALKLKQPVIIKLNNSKYVKKEEN